MVGITTTTKNQGRARMAAAKRSRSRELGTAPPGKGASLCRRTACWGSSCFSGTPDSDKKPEYTIAGANDRVSTSTHHATDDDSARDAPCLFLDQSARAAAMILVA